MIRENLRNIAIIAHVDHGKTTLVNEMLKQGGVFRENQQVANVVDTPGHADFGGEVERVLKMVDGVLLLIDSFEGPMPQTRFVLQHALALGLPVIIVINKMDRPDARCEEVYNEAFDLMIDLGADESQLDTPVVYASARAGTATLDPNVPSEDLRPLFETILKYIPAPKGDPDAPVQMLISTIDYNEFVGRIGIGRISRGTLKLNSMATRCNNLNPDLHENFRLSSLFAFEGLKRVPVESASMGEIVAITGIDRRAAALRQDHRADRRHDLLRQRQPVRRPRGHLRHLPPPARPPDARAADRRFPPRGGDRLRRFLPRQRPRRAAPLRAHREYAP